MGTAVAAIVIALAMPGSSLAKHDLPPIDVSEAESCDFIAEPDNPLCMLPFPNDYYTRPDSTSPTGLRIDFETEGMPANVLGAHIDATPYNASDGFSQGATILESDNCGGGPCFAIGFAGS